MASGVRKAPALTPNPRPSQRLPHPGDLLTPMDWGGEARTFSRTHDVCHQPPGRSVQQPCLPCGPQTHLAEWPQGRAHFALSTLPCLSWALNLGHAGVPSRGLRRFKGRTGTDPQPLLTHVGPADPSAAASLCPLQTGFACRGRRPAQGSPGPSPPPPWGHSPFCNPLPRVPTHPRTPRPRPPSEPAPHPTARWARLPE